MRRRERDSKGPSTPMLTGRESLIRLIGKRRRILPNRQSLFLANPEGSANRAEESSSAGIAKCGEDEEVKEGDIDFVSCPVCGKKVDGRDYEVNSHLDACLTKGSKRKFTQCTLLRFSFGSITKENVNLGESSCIGIDSMEKCASDNNPQSSTCMVPEFGATEDNSECISHLNSESCVEVSVENVTSEDVTCIKREDTPSTRPNSPVLDTGGSVEDASVATLDTFIVGRRFGNKVELKQGDSINVMRDPDNVKDPNAIKVLSAGSECAKVLGFLPRELSKYLSPLIEKYKLIFEGSVTTFSQHFDDIVPIQISSQEMPTSGKKEFNDDWKRVLKVVDHMKTYPPSMTKYQQNFNILIQEVLKNHCHLFTDDEKEFIDSFSSLSDESQRLFIRLYTRKGPWFRMSDVSYPEIVDYQKAIEALDATGFFCSLDYLKEPTDSDLKDVLDLLTVSELREIMKLTSSKLQRGVHSKRRNELINSLLASYRDGMWYKSGFLVRNPSLPSMVFSQTGTCVQISQTAEFLLWRVQRLFFLNGEQDLSAFLMVDLGRVKYPSYNCKVSNHIFSSRDELLAYEEAIEVAQIMDQSLDENNFEMVMRCIEISDGHLSSSSGKLTQASNPDSVGTFHSFFSASWVYSKIITLGISFLERERRYEDAVRLLKRQLSRITCDGRRGYWTLRLSIDLQHIGHLNESLSIAEEGLLDSWVRAGSRMALQRRVLRLAKPPRRWKTPSFSESVRRKIKEVHILGRPLNCDLGMKNRYYGEDGEQCGVEELVLQYYAGEEGGGWNGVHTESGIWMTIFGLLMWDIIFADVPDVFHTRFQIAPLDFETDSFYIARKRLIESHLERIKGGMAEEILITSWESHFGTSCRGLNWDRHSLCDLRAAVTCVGGPCLASICRLLAQDYRSWSSGMPDLLLWRFVGDYSGEAKLVEVKGPRDRLSEQQRAWLMILEDCGFTTEVCKVSPELLNMT